MDSVIWLFTHDIQIDRRIFFFADVFRSLYDKVKIFSAPCLQNTSAFDEPFVVRPKITETVKEYHLKSVPDYVSVCFSRIQKEQADFYKKYRRYSSSLKRLRLAAVPGFRTFIKVKGGFYGAVLEDDETVFLYSSLSNKISRIRKEFDTEECRKCEEAMLYALNHMNMDGPFVYKGIPIERITKNGGICYYANVPHSDLLFIYDEKQEVLYRQSLLHTEKYGKDELAGRIFDFKEFKEKIYDYTKIFIAMKSELEKEIPSFVYTADLPTLPIGIMLKEMYGTPVMVDCHEWWYKQTVLWEASDVKKQVLSEKYERELYARCDMRITVGHVLAFRMSEFYSLPFEVIYSSMSKKLDKTLHRDPGIWNRRFGLPQMAKIAVFQGGMTANRNLENMAAATKCLDRDSYLVIFSNGGRYEKKFKRVLKKRGNPRQVVWAGWLKEEELLEIIGNADVGIIPYIPVNDYAECFVPNKLPEYYKAHLPVLYAQGMLELERIVGADGTGIAAGLDDSEEFGHMLNQLLHDENWKEQVRERYRICEGRFRYQNQQNVVSSLLIKNFAVDL